MQIMELNLLAKSIAYYSDIYAWIWGACGWFCFFGTYYFCTVKWKHGGSRCDNF